MGQVRYAVNVGTSRVHGVKVVLMETGGQPLITTDNKYVIHRSSMCGRVSMPYSLFKAVEETPDLQAEFESYASHTTLDTVLAELRSLEVDGIVAVCPGCERYIKQHTTVEIIEAQ